MLAPVHPPHEVTMALPTFQQYQSEWLGKGFDEVLERVWAPHTVLDTHTHPFGAQALVTQGEMWLTCGAETRHLRPGDTFALDAEVPHAERYGNEGATYWVARRNLR
jgi:mannose-6-phosphate isomerase-like protein (cupin superfamily)